MRREHSGIHLHLLAAPRSALSAVARSELVRAGGVRSESRERRRVRKMRFSCKKLYMMSASGPRISHESS